MKMTNSGFWLACLLAVLALGANGYAQQPAPGVFEGPPGGLGSHEGGNLQPGGMHLLFGPGGRWWNDAEMAKRVGLSVDQQKKMDEIFTANRLKLIDLFAAVQKEETIMEPLVAADPPDENKVVDQIGRVAQARAELEKANARMLLELRRQLTHDQWVKLQSERPPLRRQHGFDMPGMRGEGGMMKGGHDMHPAPPLDPPPPTQ